MTLRRSADDFLRDVIVWGQQAIDHAAGLSRDEFLAHPMAQHAISKCIEAVGEAASRAERLDRAITQEFPDFEVAAAYRARNKLAHHYFDTDPNVIWRVVVDDLPGFIDRARDVLAHRMRKDSILPLVIVVAVAENGIIGKDNNLSWRMPSDLKHFRRITMGKPLIMGRKTFQSLGRPLPGREIVVVTRDRAFLAPGVHVAHSLDDAVGRAGDLARRMAADQIIIAGGAEIYAALLPRADRVELTRVHAAIAGDAAFPRLDPSLWRETSHSEHAAGAGDDHPFALSSLVRVAADELRGGAPPE